VIHLDTSVLIEALGGSQRSAGELRAVIETGERVVLSTLVLYEWLRGPRVPAELAAQEALFPRDAAVPFAATEAALAADLYRRRPRARGREVDLAVAACAITHDATLWTLNPEDFADIADLRLHPPSRGR
jgi:predicted nucleic acid-binding protein